MPCRSSWRSGALLLLTTLACARAEDQAAKQRVFSPPPPDPILESAKQPVDIAKIAADEDYARRVLGMTFPELHARAGSGHFTSKQSMTLRRGDNTFSVEETGDLRFNDKGDLAVELKTGANEAMQLVYSNAVLFLRNRAGNWRTSRDPSDERHFWADQTWAGLRTVLDLVKGHYTLTVKGPLTVAGRRMTRLDFGLKGPPEEPALLNDDNATLTTVPLPDGGALFRTTQDRRKALEGARPQELSGFVVLDDQKGVPVSVKLNVSLKTAGRRTTESTTLVIGLETNLEDLGQPLAINQPADFVQEIVRKRTPVNPLEFLDAGGAAAPRADPKGKKEPAPKPVEPEPTEETEEAP